MLRSRGRVSTVLVLGLLLGGCSAGGDEAVCEGYVEAGESLFASIGAGKESEEYFPQYIDALVELEAKASPEIAEELRLQIDELVEFDLNADPRPSRMPELCAPYSEQ